MQLLADGTWVPAITPGRAPTSSVSDEDEFAESLKFAVPPPRATATVTPVVQTPAKPRKSAFKTENVLSLAKARLREVKALLKQMSALEKERDELERLIAAAENKPKAAIAVVKTARTSG